MYKELQGQDCQRSKFVEVWHWRVSGMIRHLFCYIAHRSAEGFALVAPVGAVVFTWFMHTYYVPMCLTNDFWYCNTTLSVTLVGMY